MNQEITPVARPGGALQEFAFMWIDFSAPVPERAMSNIDHACGQY
jgi:hypothetical protein